jgi:hypothetical protein
MQVAVVVELMLLEELLVQVVQVAVVLVQIQQQLLLQEPLTQVAVVAVVLSPQQI